MSALTGRGHLPLFIIYELFYFKIKGWFFLLLVTRWLRKHWDLSLGRSRKQISSFSQLKCGVCVDYFCCFLCFFIIYHIYQIFVRHLLFIIVGRRREKDRCMKKLCILATGFSFLMIFSQKLCYTHIFSWYINLLFLTFILLLRHLLFFFHLYSNTNISFNFGSNLTFEKMGVVRIQLLMCQNKRGINALVWVICSDLIGRFVIMNSMKVSSQWNMVIWGHQKWSYVWSFWHKREAKLKMHECRKNTMKMIFQNVW